MEAFQPLILTLLLIINTLISVYNCWAVGRYWTEKRLLPLWPRVMCWCGAIMATCGFYWVYSVLITLGLLYFHQIRIEDAEALINLGYLIIIFPLLGTGAMITVDSTIKAYQQRNYQATGVAVWNTTAQASNTLRALQEVPEALSTVLDYFGDALSSSDDDEDNKGGAIVVLVIILTMMLGIMTTILLIQKFDRMTELNISQS